MFDIFAVTFLIMYLQDFSRRKIRKNMSMVLHCSIVNQFIRFSGCHCSTVVFCVQPLSSGRWWPPCTHGGPVLEWQS